MSEVFDYKIPAEVLKSMDDKFLDTFIQELQETFGTDVFERTGLACLQGTFGWRGSLEACCKALDAEWLYEYYRSLKWWDSDRFDDQLLEMVKGRFA